jgi:hypothetical protein
MRAAIVFSVVTFCTCLAHAQGLIRPPADSSKIKISSDTTLPTSPLTSHVWRAPQAAHNGGDVDITDEAMRYYSSPTTLPMLLEAAGGAYPLVMSDEAYGRESFLLTQRTCEPLISTSIDGLLPTNSILNGATLASYFPLDAFNDVRLNSAADGQLLIGGDYAASDAATMRIERFRAPVPYSRMHYTQDLTRSFSDFDGLFSLNASEPTNITVGLHRRSAGHAAALNDVTFNPRADIWSARAQVGVSKYLGTLPHDSRWTKQRIDSLLATSDAKKHTLDLLVWGQYTTAFSGLAGGIYSRDSTDIFSAQLAPVVDSSTYDHRVRMDAIAELELPLLAEARTRIAGYASYESRHILSTNFRVFPFWVPVLSAGSREGLSLTQPIDFNVGDFLTHAQVRGDLEVIEKGAQYTFVQPMKDTRLSATASDSLALRTALRVSLFGFVKTTESNLGLNGSPTSSLVLPSAGFAGSIGLTNALSFSASYNYAHDRAALSPSPTATYDIRNLGGWFDLRARLATSDSIAIHAGYLDRHEPEGIVYNFAADSAFPHPQFSNSDLHTQSMNATADLYLWRFHLNANATYFLGTTPLAAYTQTPSLESTLPSRFFGTAALYYENEVGEGNLRLVVGPRLRTVSVLSPQLTYDPSSDYYVYRGLPPHYSQDTSGVLQLDRAVTDSRLTTPHYILDLLLSAEVDRRAQINMGFLNILSEPYYNVSLYPRTGFHWRLDVTWAFLD